ncbi:MAG: recombinase family protein [Cyanobacteria bacterium P01_D01_bin.56]
MSTPLPLRVALYLRVSTKDGRQDSDNQLLQLQALCDRSGYQIIETYIDNESGRKGKRERTAFSQLFTDAAQRQFDLVLFWSLDRFSREGIRKTIHYLQQLDGFGVRFKSFTEPYLDTGNELVATIVLAVLSYIAQQEAVKISERTKAGLARTVKQGTKLGRPSKYTQHKATLQQLKADGAPIRHMHAATKLSTSTIQDYLKRLAAENSHNSSNVS